MQLMSIISPHCCAARETNILKFLAKKNKKKDEIKEGNVAQHVIFSSSTPNFVEFIY